MYGLVFGCLTLALAILVFALVREIRLRRAWQRLWFVFVEQETRNAEENGLGPAGDMPSIGDSGGAGRL
jgi:hypothetical protein